MQGIQFIGTQRSGSNLLRLMLNELPEISAPHPPHLLKTFTPLLDRYGDLETYDSFKLLASDIHSWVKRNPVAWSNWNVDLHQLIECASERTVISLFTAVYETMALIDNAGMWCCKSLANVSYVENLEANNVHPLYIHLVRDGRDVACSFKKAIVGPKHIYHLAKKWSEEQQLALEVSKKYADRYILVRYEDLIQAPAKELRRICTAIGVQYRESALQYYRSEESALTAKSGEMWKNVVNPVIQDNRNKYSKMLSQNEIDIFNLLAKDELMKFGYIVSSFDEPGTIPEFDLQEFDVMNKRLMDEAQSNASPVDRSLRQPQADLLREIESRDYHLTYNDD